MEQNVNTSTPVAGNKQKNGNGLKIATIIACIVAICGIGFGVYGIMQSSQKDKQISDLEAKNESSSSLDGFTINNSGVARLFELVRARSDSSTCWGLFDYYEVPFKNLSVEEKVIIALMVNEKYSKQILTEDLYQKLPDHYKLFGYNNAYIEADLIRRELKYLFNLENVEFHEQNWNSPSDNAEYYVWNYVADADIFGEWGGDGCVGQENWVESIIGYNDNGDTIDVVVVKADAQDSGIYRNVYKDEAPVLPYDKNFRFTKDNVDKFPQLKYIFKKNSAGAFYLYDVININ